MSNALHRLIDILQLEQESPNRFVGESEHIGVPHVFGGQIVAQALSAAMRCVEPQRTLHACYTTFLQSGELELPLYYQTEILRDGNSFTVVNVDVFQREERIAKVLVSFQTDEQGIEYQCPMPSAKLPEKLYDESAYITQVAEHLPSPLKEIWKKERAFDVRIAHLNPLLQGKKQPTEQTIWARVNNHLHLPYLSEQRLQQCLLAYFSDFHCLLTMLQPHGIGMMQKNLKIATLNHNLYFHRDIDLSDWTLFSLQNTNANGARGLTRGEVFSKDGKLLASYQQEGLIRL